MIRFITILLFICFGLTSFAQDKDLIPWQAERRLTWGDFVKKRDNGPNGLKALTTAGIGVEFECNGPEPRVMVSCHFKKKESWTRTTESKALLAHEQLHFDATELFARKLRKKLSDLKYPCGKGSGKVQGIYNSNFKELHDYQERYDKQTKHGLNEKVQAEWIQKVAKDLKEVEAFSSK
jgi:hypothetical protein